MKLKVIDLNINGQIVFEDGYILRDYHDQYCCEHHYLDISEDLKYDLIGCVFDLSDENFFDRIYDYGIALKPLNNHPIRIAGYGSNNGYYSSNLSLELLKYGEVISNWCITEFENKISEFLRNENKHYR